MVVKPKVQSICKQMTEMLPAYNEARRVINRCQANQWAVPVDKTETVKAYDELERKLIAARLERYTAAPSTGVSFLGTENSRRLKKRHKPRRYVAKGERRPEQKPQKQKKGQKAANGQKVKRGQQAA